MEREADAAESSQPEPADPWLQRAANEGWLIRWSVHFNAPRDSTSTPDPEPPRLRGDRLIIWILEAIGVTMLFGFVGILLPFTIIWLMAAAIGHHEGAVRAYLIFSYATMALGTVIMLRSFFSRSWWAKRSERLFAALLAVYMLPWFMYATSAPGMMDFEVMTHADWSPFWRWVVFWGYLFIDVIALGAPEAFFGHMAALQPASWAAALNTFLIRGVMTIGAIWCMWSFLADRLRGRHEFTGTVDDLRQYIAGELGAKERLRVYARAIERELTDGPQGRPGDQVLADIEAIAGSRPTGDTPEAAQTRDANSSASLNRVHPAMMVGVSVASAVTISTLLLIGFYIREPSLFIAKALIWIVPTVLVVALVLVVVRKTVTSRRDNRK